MLSVKRVEVDCVTINMPSRNRYCISAKRNWRSLNNKLSAVTASSDLQDGSCDSTSRIIQILDIKIGPRAPTLSSRTNFLHMDIDLTPWIFSYTTSTNIDCLDPLVMEHTSWKHFWSNQTPVSILKWYSPSSWPVLSWIFILIASEHIDTRNILWRYGWRFF